MELAVYSINASCHHPSDDGLIFRSCNNEEIMCVFGPYSISEKLVALPGALELRARPGSLSVADKTVTLPARA